MPKKILLVDDAIDHLEMLARYCQQIDIAHVTAGNGDQAIACLKKESFSIVVSDIHMSGIDGITLLHYIKQHFPETDVILVTGFSETYSFTDVIREGATDYLEKPFTKDALNAKIQRVFREREQIAGQKRLERDLHLSHLALEKKVAQKTKDLQNSQSELLSIFANVPDGIISVDNSMRVLHKNDKYMSKITVEIGRVFKTGSSPLQQECHHILNTTLSTGTAVNDYRVEFQKGENKHRTFLLSSSSILSLDGIKTGALIIIHDITRVATLEKQITERRRSRFIIGESSKMQEIYQRIRQISTVDTTVLITGESGVGKELIVDTLHLQGDRSEKPLVKVNCSALPENLLESELFGHVKGAFTGASKDRMGRIELAEGGILFLDEIGDISPNIQIKLLRFLEQKEYEKVGDSHHRTADVRIFAATNIDLQKKVKAGTFREDLYYRLKVMLISCPSLRKRKEDIPLLINHFISFFNDKFNKRIKKISPEALSVLMAYSWPGNIRELKHAFEHAFLLCQTHTLYPDNFPNDIFAGHNASEEKTATTRQIYQPARKITRESLLNTLEQTRWNRTETARILQISRSTLYNKLKEFGFSQGPTS